MEISHYQHNNRLLTPGVMALGIGVSACAMLSFFFFKSSTDRSGYSWIWLLSVIQLTPFLIGIAIKSQNYLNFILLNHFISHSLAKFNEVQNLTRTYAVAPSWIFATKELTLCTLIIMCTYYLSRVTLISRPLRDRPFIDLTLNTFQLRMITLYVILIPVLNDSLPYAVKIIHFALSSAQTLLIICSQSPKNQRMHLFARLSVPCVAMISFLLYGFLTMFGNYVGFLLVYSFTKSKVLHIIPILLLTVFVSAIQSVKNEYRGYLGATEYESPILERVNFLWLLLENQYFNSDEKESDLVSHKDEDADQALMRGFSRVGDDSLERVLQMTPKEVPFWLGETYDSIPYMLIPRALWADKPSRHFWNKYGRAYKVLSTDDSQTSVTVGFLAEAYMNFGFAWMYLLAGFLGVFFVLVERMAMMFLKEKFYFTYISFIGPLLSLGSDLGTLLNSVLIMTCCFTLVRPFLLRLARRDDYSF